MTTNQAKLPRISIVVPSYNQGHFLPDALHSLFRQEYPDLEIVVMDGGSSDNSVDIIRSHAPRLKYWQSQKDGGQSAAINAGVRHCTGEIVAWLNSDDYYCDDALWSVGRAYAEYPGRGLYIGNGLRLDQASGRLTPFCSRHIALDRAALLQGTDYILQPSTFFLRKAWEEMQGLDRALNFCMDWDLFLRIANRYPAVLLQEFLAVTREYEDTKTRNGKMKRAAEIVRMVQSHTGTEVTAGSLLFLCETLIDVTREGAPTGLNQNLRDAQAILARRICTRFGGGHGFPERSDSQDEVFLPFATSASELTRNAPKTTPMLSITVIIPARSRNDDLAETLDSIRDQRCGQLAPLVIDMPESGLAHAVRQGLAQADGDIVGWLQPGDLLAEGAAHQVAQAFADDPDLDLVYGNAVSIDGYRRFHLADQGAWLSGLWLGALSLPGKIPAHDTEVFAVPQPTVFFRKRLLDRLGTVDVSFPRIFEYELLRRFASSAKIKKIERIQAFVRVRPEESPGRWNEILVELYRLSRPHWPGLLSRQFPRVLTEFMLGYVGRKFLSRRWRPSTWAAAALVAMSAVLKIGNPERWWAGRFSLPTGEAPPLRLPVPRFRHKQILYMPPRSPGMYHSVFCAPRLPAEESGRPNDAGDLRVLRNLHPHSTVEFFTERKCLRREAKASAGNIVDAVHSWASIAALRPDLIGSSRSVRWRRFCLMLEGRYSWPILRQLVAIEYHFRGAVQFTLERVQPDFLFVSPETNPLALTLATADVDTRMILIVHEPEIARTMSHEESRRADRFRRDNLALYDGVIALPASNRREWIEWIGDLDIARERIHVLAAEKDANFATWLDTLRTLPRRNGQPGLRATNPIRPALRIHTEAA